MTVSEAFAYFIVSILVGLAGVCVVVFTELRSLIQTYLRRQTRQVSVRCYTNSLKNIGIFMDTIEELKKIDSVERILVFIGHNGGGLPVPGKSYTIKSELGWAKSQDIKPILGRFNFDLQVDSFYVKMLETVVSEGHVINTAADMTDDCFLKRIYLEEGVAQSIVYLLHCEPSELTYISVASHKGLFSASDKRKMELLVARLRSVAT